MFNLLIDKLPTSVIVSGTEYPINWDARTMIQISTLIEVQSDDAEDYAKTAAQQLALFYHVIPDNVPEAMEQLINFYACAIDDYSKPKKGNKTDFNEKRSYSLHYDSNLIYSAFLQQYPTKRIDELHWFEFKAMLANLTDDCLFVKVTQWRTAKLNSDMSKAEKQFYRRMKRLYALPDNRPQEVKEAEFANALFRL